MMAEPGEPQRRLRTDARENRLRVLEAAAAAFAEEGVSVPLDEIARRAGVGAGTVYRHFPSKEQLFQAVVLGSVEELIARARELSRGSDAGEAFFKFFSELVRAGWASRGLLEALASAGIDIRDTAFASAGTELKRSLGRLLVGAQHAGAVRKDLTPADLNAVLTGALSMQPDSGETRSAEIVLAVVTDGLRTQA